MATHVEGMCSCGRLRKLLGLRSVSESYDDDWVRSWIHITAGTVEWIFDNFHPAINRRMCRHYFARVNFDHEEREKGV